MQDDGGEFARVTELNVRVGLRDVDCRKGRGRSVSDADVGQIDADRAVK